MLVYLLPQLLINDDVVRLMRLLADDLELAVLIPALPVAFIFNLFLFFIFSIIVYILVFRFPGKFLRIFQTT